MGAVGAVALTPDGRRGLSGSWDASLRLWDLETGQCLRILEGHTAEVRAVAVTPDGHRALSGAGDHTLRLWDLEGGQCLRTLEGHTGPVQAVASCQTQNYLRIV
jgi:WD40 repeat protein